LKDAATGKIIPVYEDYNLISFDAEAVPSMGYKTYLPILEPILKEATQGEGTLKIDKKNNLLENRYFRLQIDEQKGIVSSLFDKLNNRELVDQNSDKGFGEYFLERPGKQTIDTYNKAYVKPGAEGWANDEMIRPDIPQKERRVYTGSCERIVYLDMGNAIRATVFGKLNDQDSQDYLVTYTLYENQAYVEIVWGVDGKKPNSLPEAGWLSFPFEVDRPEYRLYRTGAIVDPQTEFIERTNQDFYFLNTSMTMFNSSGSGVALNCPGSPGVSIDSPGLFKFSGKKQLSTGDLYVNLYNTQWGTNFTEWIEGSFASRMYIWSYNKYDSEKQLITPSEETRVPLKAVFYEGTRGKSPVMQEGIALDRKGIVLTAFKEEGAGTLIRLWEQAGKGGTCTLTLSEYSAYKKAFLCNLRGEILDENGIDLQNNSFQFNIKAYQPMSFILK